MSRNKAFFINGGAGRVLCSIPALEKFHEENPDNDFIIVCEGSTEFYKGHPVLHARVYDHWHKNLFEDKLRHMELVSPEPYRIWEYYNQKASLAQAYDIAINNKGVRDLPRPVIKLNKQELITGQTVINDVKEKTKKDKVIVFQPFGRGIIEEKGIITDFGGRSFEAENVVNIIKKLSKDYAIIFMGEISIDFAKHGVTESVAIPQGIDLRAWSGIIAKADHFLGCDSVGQHIAYAFAKPQNPKATHINGKRINIISGLSLQAAHLATLSASLEPTRLLYADHSKLCMCQCRFVDRLPIALCISFHQA